MLVTTSENTPFNAHLVNYGMTLHDMTQESTDSIVDITTLLLLYLNSLNQQCCDSFFKENKVACSWKSLSCMK